MSKTNGIVIPTDRVCTYTNGIRKSEPYQSNPGVCRFDVCNRGIVKARLARLGRCSFRMWS